MIDDVITSTGLNWTSVWTFWWWSHLLVKWPSRKSLNIVW